MKCKHCKFFKFFEEVNVFLEEVNGFGKCHKYAPRPSAAPYECNQWPEVQPDDWCGEFELCEEKVSIGIKNPIEDCGPVRYPDQYEKKQELNR